METSGRQAITRAETAECSERQVGEKPETMRAENPQCSGRQLGDKCADQSTQSIQDVLGDKWGTTEVREEMRDKALRASKLNVLRDKWETSGDKWEKGLSCEPKHSEHPGFIGRQVGDKPEIPRAENPECSGRQVGECEIMRTKALRSSRVSFAG